MAIGTIANLSIVFEDHLDLANDGKYFLPLGNSNSQEFEKNYKIDEQLNKQKTDFKNFKFINQIDSDSKKAISFFGDLHRDFEGSVVKAMASAKKGAQEIEQIINEVKSCNAIRDVAKDFLVKIIEINRLSSHVVEIVISAPLLSIKTKVGQIFRLQNYAKFTQEINEHKLLMEGIAITALSIDKDKGIITGIVVETGGSTSLIKNFKKNEPCVFMCPSGKPTEITKN